MEPAVRSPRIKSAITADQAKTTRFWPPRLPKFPAADRHWPSKPCRGERNFWVQRLEAKNRPVRPQGSPETERVERYQRKSPQKRPVLSQPGNLQFGGTGWWWTQSPANRSRPATPCYSLLFAFFQGKESLPFAVSVAARSMFLRVNALCFPRVNYDDFWH